MSMSYDDCQDIAKERELEEAQDEIRQRLLGPIGFRPNPPGPRQPLRTMALEAIAKAAERLVENDHFNDATQEWVVNDDDLDELAQLLDDLGTIEEEGW